MLVLVALCILPAIASAAIPEPFTVPGKVYCDTCRVGYETPATTYLPGKPSPSHFHSFSLFLYGFSVLAIVGLALIVRSCGQNLQISCVMSGCFDVSKDLNVRAVLN